MAYIEFIDRENELRQSKPPASQPPQRPALDPWTRSQRSRSFAPLKDVKIEYVYRSMFSKIQHQIEDLEKVSGILSSTVDSYLTKFVWDEAKYPTMSPLKEIVDGINVQVAKIDDDLKVRIAEYNNAHSQLNAINRKQTGRFSLPGCTFVLFAESILRYGLPPSFPSVVLSPSVKSEKKVRSILELYAAVETEDDGGMGSLGGDADTHPYVSFTINLI
ncbi:unnamed protein product [Lactuca saligna]|uniref:V-type proton ATPase subunit C n=1 Tax=Lactuca saligna TaxID=75948 RepID=A0AA36E538_LACSI|nr:unnamed protein product [Lactuca saligna]